VLQVSPHKSRNKLFNEKVHGDSTNIDGISYVMAGQHLEAGILGWHCAHRGFDFPGPWDQGLVPSPSCPHLAATPDAVVFDKANVPWVTEIKNVGLVKVADDWQRNDGVYGATTAPVETFVHATKRAIPDKAKLRAPLHYWVQLQVQMHCLGIPRGRIVVCFGGQHRADLDYTLHEGFVSRMILEVGKFWEQIEAGRELRNVG
jgi:hypothetical protein